jgi:RNA polymerase sigma-70 factor (ECF subfamily)
MFTIDRDMTEHTNGMERVPPTENATPRSEPETARIDSPRDWFSLVERIKSGDQAAMSELYGLFSKGIRFYLCRQLGPQELDDKVHDTFLIVVNAVQRGDLREPERLMGFVRTIVRRQVAAYIDQAVQTRRELADMDGGVVVADTHSNPEQKAIGKQNEDLMRQVLRSMSSRDRDILMRFYLQEQSQEQICADMNLTETQFRLLKSRAKARFGELGRRKLQKKAPSATFMRTIASVANFIF